MSNTSKPAVAETLLLELLQTAAETERRLDRALSFRGLSFSEFKLLRALMDAPGHGRARIELAESVGLTASGVTRSLRPMEKLGYVTTTRNDRDARQSLTALTEAGEALYAEAAQAVTDYLSSLPVSTLGARRLQTLRDFLHVFHPERR